MNSNVSFFRELPLTISIDGKLSFFKLAAGFSKPVDLQSGMTVNLVLVNQWLKEAIQHLSAGNFADEQAALRRIEGGLRDHARSVGAELTRVQLTGEDESVTALDASGFSFRTSRWSTDEKGRRVRVHETRWSDPHSSKPDRVEILDPISGISVIQS